MEKNDMTAVEWLAKELENYGNPQVCEINWEILDAFINKAKQIEKEQLDKAYYKGQESKYIGGPSYCEQYYNEIYGTTNSNK